MKDFAPAPVSPSPLGCEHHYLSRVMPATHRGASHGHNMLYPVWWGLVVAGGHMLSKGWPSFASGPPLCPQAGLLWASSASCSQEERTEWRTPGAWPSFCLPQLVPGSTHCRPMLVSVCCAAACSPRPLSSFLFPFCAPSHASFY